jgi:hypothetical protein
MKKSYRLEYNKIKECEILIFGDDSKLLSFFKMKHWICKESTHLKKSYLFNNDFLKMMHWGTFNFFYKLQKNSFKNSFACKIVFWEKGLAISFQSNCFGSWL